MTVLHQDVSELILVSCRPTQNEKDKDGDHTITEEEFAERCLQLHGPARSADLFALKLGTVTWWVSFGWHALHEGI